MKLTGPSPPSNEHDGRLMLGVGGLLFIPISAMGSYFLAFDAPRPQGALEWTFRILMEELAISATLFFTLGFLWAISGSRRLKRLLDIATLKFAWIFLPIATVGIAGVLLLVASGMLS